MGELRLVAHTTPTSRDANYSLRSNLVAAFANNSTLSTAPMAITMIGGDVDISAPIAQGSMYTDESLNVSTAEVDDAQIRLSQAPSLAEHAVQNQGGEPDSSSVSLRGSGKTLV